MWAPQDQRVRELERLQAQQRAATTYRQEAAAIAAQAAAQAAAEKAPEAKGKRRNRGRRAPLDPLPHQPAAVSACG